MPSLWTQVSAELHPGHDQFFRSRLLILDADRIVQEIERMEREAESLRSEAMKMSWYMRGGLTYGEAMMLSFREREIVGRLVKENLETTKKSGLPFF